MLWQLRVRANTLPMTTLCWIIGLLGAFICVLNFSLSARRYPIHNLLGDTRENYKYVSGFPVVGSIFVLALLVPLSNHPLAMLCVGVLALIDTGGIHWCLLALVRGMSKQGRLP